MMQQEQQSTAILYEVRDRCGAVLGQEYVLEAVTCATVFSEEGRGHRIGAWFTSEALALNSVALCRQPWAILPAAPAPHPAPPMKRRRATIRTNPRLTPDMVREAMSERKKTPLHIVAQRMGVKPDTLRRAIGVMRRRIASRSKTI